MKLCSSDNHCTTAPKINWDASQICMSSLCRSHANLLFIVPILIYVYVEIKDFNKLIDKNNIFYQRKKKKEARSVRKIS